MMANLLNKKILNKYTFNSIDFSYLVIFFGLLSVILLLDKVVLSFMIMIFLPLMFGGIIMLINKKHIIYIKQLTLYITVFVFILSLLLINNYNFYGDFHYFFEINWFNMYGINYSLGLDGISILFILLTTFLMPICVLISWSNIKYRLKEYMVCLLFIEFFLLNIFCCLDLLVFYIFFESILLPMFILIGVWGSRYRKIHASYQFFFYTLLSSIFMLLGIIIIYFNIGTTDMKVFISTNFSENRQLILWLSFFLPFAVKVPMVPLHIWLPEAHVEAPTAGSILLAGVLLKLGVYGVLRFLIPVFIYANIYFTPLVMVFAIISIIYGSFTTIRQIDLKKIIAYSSVVHMNFALVGLFSMNFQGISGSIYLMLSHGIVSGALFLCVGILYDRYHSRLLKYYGGLVVYMPLYSIFFLLFTMANIGLPGTSSFIGEFLIILGSFKFNFIVSLLSTTSVVLGACYAIWLYNRLIYGNINIDYIKKFSDINEREFYSLLLLGLIVLIGGIYPSLFMNIYEISVYKLLTYY